MKLLLTFWGLLFSVLLNAQYINVFSSEFCTNLLTENWQIVFQELGKELSNGKDNCGKDPIKRFLIGHAALITGKNSVSTAQFYCECDSNSSETLNKWMEFTQDLINKYPDSQVVHYLYADAFARQGDFMNSKNELNKALLINPDHVPSLNQRAVINWLLYENSSSKENSFKIDALNDINKAIQINPKFADLYANKAIFNMRISGSMDYARSDLEKSLKIDSLYYLTLNSLAVSYGEEGNIQRYNDIRNFVLKNNPNTPYINLSIKNSSSNKTKAIRGNVLNTEKYMGGFNLGLNVGILSMNASYKFQMSSTYDARGGIFTYLKEGENLEQKEGGEPIIIGTWFNYNYPYQIITPLGN